MYIVCEVYFAFILQIHVNYKKKKKTMKTTGKKSW